MTIFTLEWYTTCTQTLAKYQKETVEQEDVKWNNTKRKYMDELRNELIDIAKYEKEALESNGDRDLLVWLYKT